MESWVVSVWPSASVRVTKCFGGCFSFRVLGNKKAAVVSRLRLVCGLPR